MSQYACGQTQVEVQLMMHSPGTMKLCARYYSRSQERPSQATELAWALREEIGLA